MDECDLHLESLIESAISECEELQRRAEANGPVWLAQSASEAAQAMRQHQVSVRNGKLVRPSDGAGLGFSRGLGEWAEHCNKLMDLAYEIDRYYSEACNSTRVGS